MWRFDDCRYSVVLALSPTAAYHWDWSPNDSLWGGLMYISAPERCLLCQSDLLPSRHLFLKPKTSFRLPATFITHWSCPIFLNEIPHPVPDPLSTLPAGQQRPETAFKLNIITVWDLDNAKHTSTMLEKDKIKMLLILCHIIPTDGTLPDGTSHCR